MGRHIMSLRRFPSVDLRVPLIAGGPYHLRKCEFYGTRREYASCMMILCEEGMGLGVFVCCSLMAWYR